MALAGCGSTTGLRASTPTTAQRVAAGGHLRWRACDGADGPSGYQCATLAVPLDWADPAKGSIGLALDRHRASGHLVGSLVVNPGGPGESGVDYLPDIMSLLPGSITEHFDVVGFDPPGVNLSDPVTCGTPSQLEAELTVDPAPTTRSGFDALVRADRAFAEGCEAHSARILPYVSTVDAAHDLDFLRRALGERGLTYLGFSYGTFLGATYAGLFPTHVRAMVLDGALDPALGPIALSEEQSASLEGELDDFFHSCRAGSCGWDPPGDLTTDYERLVAQVSAHPVAVAGTGQSVDAAVMLYGSAAALYEPQDWPLLGEALSALERGQGRDLVELFDDYVGRRPNGTFQNIVEAENAVDCLDAPAPSLSALRAAAPEVERRAPVFGLLDLYGEATCSVWPVAATGVVGAIHAPGAPPIVVVGTTHDPITPYAWAEALAHQLDSGVLLTRDGYGHTAYGASACIREDVDRYLLTLQPPRPGTVCPSNA